MGWSSTHTHIQQRNQIWEMSGPHPLRDRTVLLYRSVESPVDGPLTGTGMPAPTVGVPTADQNEGDANLSQLAFSRPTQVLEAPVRVLVFTSHANSPSDESGDVLDRFVRYWQGCISANVTRVEQHVMMCRLTVVRFPVLCCAHVNIQTVHLPRMDDSDALHGHEWISEARHMNESLAVLIAKQQVLVLQTPPPSYLLFCCSCLTKKVLNGLREQFHVHWIAFVFQILPFSEAYYRFLLTHVTMLIDGTRICRRHSFPTEKYTRGSSAWSERTMQTARNQSFVMSSCHTNGRMAGAPRHRNVNRLQTALTKTMHANKRRFW